MFFPSCNFPPLPRIYYNQRTFQVQSMPNSSIPAQTNSVDIGYLQIQTLSAENQFPIQDARVAISYTGQPDSVIETLETDSSGQTENIALEAPPLEYSETPGSPQPYSEYTFESPRKYACYIGVAPFDYTSGTSIRGKTQVSKICRTQQKAELSMAARSAIVHDPGLRRYYQRKMKEKGGDKSAHGIVINAIKFKLILRMFAVVRAGEPYRVLNY